MTLFVVSLFLPYTINFDVPSSASPKRVQAVPPSSRASNKAGSTSVPSLFDAKTPGNPTPPETPTATSYEEVFTQPAKPVTDSYFPPHLEASVIARSDPHSPTWGSNRLFNQPKSRAAEAPPPSILKHTRVEEKLTSWKAGAKESLLKKRKPGKPRDRSHDRLFAEANWSVKLAEHGNGGLHNAVRAACDNGSLLEKTWIGTIGMPTDALTETRKKDIDEKLVDEHDALTIWCKDSDLDGQYNHYCKQILWPVFHYQIPDNPKSKAYEDHSWVYYVKVNQAFADKIVQSYKRGDVIWVHDYHLMLVPSMVRQKRPDAKIGFFLHVAFPSSEVFRCLATRKELLEGLLGCNLIGFQTSEYCRHFLQTCSRLLNVEATSDSVQLEDRVVNVANFAIGIDPSALSLSRESPSVAEWVEVMQERYAGKRLIVARDKLDHIRGVRQKLLSYELFLNKYPEWRDETVLIQVATSTTEQAELDATVSDIVTRINSTHATLAHQPLVFLKQDISFQQYVALMTVADVLMVTSLREGMNLTSQEFVFFQDGKLTDKKHGSLILSEFTGSSSVFGESALAINPWDYRRCADAIKVALEMGPEIRDQKWREMYDIVTTHTASKWFTSFLDRLDEVYDEQHARDSVSTPRLSINALGEKYKQAKQRLFILDYEGTLASWGSPSSIVLTSPQRVLDVLNDMILDERNVVWIMSGRKPEELERLFRLVPGLGLIAENGCFLKEGNADSWTEMADYEKMNAFKTSVKGILDYYQERNEGSWVEERYCSLVFHCSNTKDPQGAHNQAGECANHLNEACESQRVRAIPLDGDVLVEPLDWNKGTAAAWVLDKLQRKNAAIKGHAGLPDFLMVAGNDRDDETIFRWANKLGAEKMIKSVTTVSVGSRNTEAMATLTQGVTGALSALQKLAALSNKA